MKKIYYLSEVKEKGEYTYMGCIDDSYKKILVSYGFINKVKFRIISCSKSTFIISILGSRYLINLALAKVILVQEVKYV